MNDVDFDSLWEEDPFENAPSNLENVPPKSMDVKTHVLTRKIHLTRKRSPALAPVASQFDELFEELYEEDPFTEGLYPEDQTTREEDPPEVLSTEEARKRTQLAPSPPAKRQKGLDRPIPRSLAPAWKLSDVTNLGVESPFDPHWRPFPMEELPSSVPLDGGSVSLKCADNTRWYLPARTPKISSPSKASTDQFDDLFRRARAENERRELWAAQLSRQAPATDPVAAPQLWSEKYRAQSYLDLVSPETAHRAFLSWAQDLRAGMEGTPNAILVDGPAGVGKTTMCHVLLRHLGYVPVEINASESRTEEDVVQIAKSLLVGRGNQRLLNAEEMGYKDKIGRGESVLLMDEVDGCGARALTGLCNLLNKTTSRKPTVTICNNILHPNLRQLRQCCRRLSVPTSDYDKLQDRLRDIVRVEKVRVGCVPLSRLVTQLRGDVRHCLNSLQVLTQQCQARNASHITDADMEQHTRIMKDQTLQEADTLQRLLLPDAARFLRDAHVSQADSDRVVSYLQEHALLVPLQDPFLFEIALLQAKLSASNASDPHGGRTFLFSACAFASHFRRHATVSQSQTRLRPFPACLFFQSARRRELKLQICRNIQDAVPSRVRGSMGGAAFARTIGPRLLNLLHYVPAGRNLQTWLTYHLDPQVPAPLCPFGSVPPTIRFIHHWLQLLCGYGFTFRSQPVESKTDFQPRMELQLQPQIHLLCNRDFKSFYAVKGPYSCRVDQRYLQVPPQLAGYASLMAKHVVGATFFNAAVAGVASHPRPEATPPPTKTTSSEFQPTGDVAVALARCFAAPTNGRHCLHLTYEDGSSKAVEYPSQLNDIMY
ncbi:MAG: uncharacterized protein KVP18_001664 [Porospora cf. gigantea A]|uniref:uncharacterized protein n=1 Tax=Porospora cf. gigantea A TaxID=2853593 RepID=UPI003559C6B1|nr:MAG: hypothetical protein KVP18_001664 [Porospora cf. gigantea A]